MVLLFFLGIFFLIVFFSVRIVLSEEKKRQKEWISRHGHGPSLSRADVINKILGICDEMSNNSRVTELLDYLVSTCDLYQNELTYVDIYSSSIKIDFPKIEEKSSPDNDRFHIAPPPPPPSYIREPIEIPFQPYDVMLKSKEDIVALMHLLVLRCPYLEYRCWIREPIYRISKWTKKQTSYIERYVRSTRRSRDFADVMFSAADWWGTTYETISYTSPVNHYPSALVNAKTVPLDVVPFVNR